MTGYIRRYFRNNLLQSVPLFLCIMVLTFLLMLSSYIKNASVYLAQEIKKDISYEIRLEGRMISEHRFQDYMGTGENILYEYKEVKDFLTENQADFDPILHTLAPDMNVVITNDIERYLEEHKNDGDVYSSITDYYLFGADEEYFPTHDIEITDGRALKNGNSGEMVINENTWRIVDGEAEKVDIGDILSFPVGIVSESTPYRFAPIVFVDYEVVGIYKKRNVNVFSVEKEDYVLNKRFYISKEDCFFHLELFFNEYQRRRLIPSLMPNNGRLFYYMPDFAFNNAVIYYNNEQDLLQGLKKTEEFLKENSKSGSDENKGLLTQNPEDIEDGKRNSYVVSSSLDIVTSILSPLSSLRTNIVLFSIMDIILSVSITVLLLFISFRKRTVEFSVKQVLGMSYNDTMKEAALENTLVALAGVLGGYLICRLSAAVIINSIFKESLKFQNNLLRIASGKIDALRDYESITINYQEVQIGIVYQIVLFFGILLFIAAASMLVYKISQSKNIRKAFISE